VSLNFQRDFSFLGREMLSKGSGMFSMLFECLSRFHMLKFNPNCELRGWKFNQTVIFRERAFERQLGLDKVD
jgi:hypothetical protein